MDMDPTMDIAYRIMSMCVKFTFIFEPFYLLLIEMNHYDMMMGGAGFFWMRGERYAQELNSFQFH